MQDAAVKRPQRILEPVPGCDPIIGRALAAITEARGRTLSTLNGITTELLDSQPETGGNSIGSLLYHIAAIELDWLQTDVLEDKPLPEELWAMFPSDVRDEHGHLSTVRGDSLKGHYARLGAVRGTLTQVYRAMSVDDFFRPRAMPDYDVSPEWVIHHLIQHEAEHRIHIAILKERS
jgi:uncharacterized damage-inducible protein DinB